MQHDFHQCIHPCICHLIKGDNAHPQSFTSMKYPCKPRCESPPNDQPTRLLPPMTSPPASSLYHPHSCLCCTALHLGLLCMERIGEDEDHVGELVEHVLHSVRDITSAPANNQLTSYVPLALLASAKHQLRRHMLVSNSLRPRLVTVGSSHCNCFVLLNTPRRIKVGHTPLGLGNDLKSLPTGKANLVISSGRGKGISSPF